MATTTTAALRPAQLEDRNDFVGWVFTGETPRSVLCPSGSTAYTSDEYLNCCATSSNICHIATECVDNTLRYDGTSPITCPSQCATLTILPTNDATTSLSAQSRMFCATGGAAGTVYRRLAESDYPQSTTTATSSTDADKPTRSRGNDNPEDGDSGVGSSNAWIAGAVLGPLLFIALIAIGFLLFRQRRRKAKAINSSVDNLKSPPKMSNSLHNVLQSINGSPYEDQHQGAYHIPNQAHKMENPSSQTWNAPAELDTVQRFEIGTSGATPSELTGESGFRRAH